MRPNPTDQNNFHVDIQAVSLGGTQGLHPFNVSTSYSDLAQHIALDVFINHPIFNLTCSTFTMLQNIAGSEWSQVGQNWLRQYILKCIYLGFNPPGLSYFQEMIPINFKPSLATVTGWGIDPTYIITQAVAHGHRKNRPNSQHSPSPHLALSATRIEVFLPVPSLLSWQEDLHNVRLVKHCPGEVHQ